jgi:hypothetical protein
MAMFWMLGLLFIVSFCFTLAQLLRVLLVGGDKSYDYMLNVCGVFGEKIKE